MFPISGYALNSVHDNHVDVIAIQSQVVYGSVGNSIAVPALHRHGLNVLAIPTWLLSNTPHFDTCYGGQIPDEWFDGYLQGITDRGLNTHVRSIILGYINSEHKAVTAAEWIKQMRKTNPDIMVIVDPVMGDSDTGLYVDSSMPSSYRNLLAPQATGLTPNVFELATFCGVSGFSNEAEIVQAARTLLNDITRWVVVTSAILDHESSTLRTLCVTETQSHSIEHAWYPDAPKGTGDLFTAEFTAWLLHGLSVFDAAERGCRYTEQSVSRASNARLGELRIVF
jgi:pyridoxine kinase